jgi:hypothetical protein
MESVTGQTTIPLSKAKLRWSIAGAGVFVIVGALELVFATSFSVLYRAVFGGAAIAFFGSVGVLGVRRLIAMPPGLTLTPEGLVGNSISASIGLIPWADIARITATSVSMNRFLVLHLRDPAPYLARGNLFQRMTLRMNQKLVGSPVAIAATTLSVSFDELSRLVQGYLDRYGAAPTRMPSP